MFTIPKDGLLTFRNRAIKYKKEAQGDINICYHPDCNEKSINTHILQKNGILSEISPDRHLRKLLLNRFKEPHYEFKRKGIEQVFCFNGFCNKHDTELFREIETKDIDFDKYSTFLKFSLRALYNEINRKEVIVKYYKRLLDDFPIYSNPRILAEIKQKELGIQDFQNVESRIWSDINSGTENYIFEYRELPFIEICASGFFTYETTEEIIAYEQKYGKQYPEYTNIFISFFPYKGKSILQMGYPKEKELVVKPYFNQFFKLSAKKAYRLLTNVLLFSEIWVCSESYYKKNIEKNEDLFLAAYFSNRTRTNQRALYDLNFIDVNFMKKFEKWVKKHDHMIDYH